MADIENRVEAAGSDRREPDYEPPTIEELDTSDGPALAAAGVGGIGGSDGCRQFGCPGA